MAGRVEADPRLIEEAVRAVPGVAFAEVHTGAGEGLLTLVLWQGADAAECAYRIETALREGFEIELRPSDIRVVGYANPRAEGAPEVRPAPSPPAGEGPPPPELRIIELDGAGGTTWATEPVRPGDGLPSLPDAEPSPAGIPPAGEAEAPAGEADGPDAAASTAEPEAVPGAAPPPRAPLNERAIIASLTVERVVVAEGAEEVEVLVELRLGDRLYSGEAAGPPTITRRQRSLCHATLRAVTAVVPGLRLDLEHAALVDYPEPAVVVVVTQLEAAGERRLVGAALAGRDPATAFVRATLAALR